MDRIRHQAFFILSILSIHVHFLEKETTRRTRTVARQREERGNQRIPSTTHDALTAGSAWFSED